MDRREKAILNRKKAPILNMAWHVGAAQARYSEDGNWYHLLTRFPAALFDLHGYVVFPTEEEYRASPYLNIGKEIGVPKGISAIPSYVRVVDSEASPVQDVDIHDYIAIEGRRRLVLHLQRERNQKVVRDKKKLAKSLDCEVCGFSFGRVYGNDAEDYCEVHHLQLLSESDESAKTRLKDLSILCSNCHRVVHLRNPPFTLAEVRLMLKARDFCEQTQ